MIAVFVKPGEGTTIPTIGEGTTWLLEYGNSGDAARPAVLAFQVRKGRVSWPLKSKGVLELLLSDTNPKLSLL